MAGYRAAFVIGDSGLIDQIRQVRKHAGLMVPQPIQQSMIAALSDDTHAKEQAKRYEIRRQKLLQVLPKDGFTIEHSKAGLYIWCTRNEDCYKTADWFAGIGILVTPGAFCGSSDFVRIALTATDQDIDQVVKRVSK
jgi:aspartate/methionine/tyrosine aminotransferase